MNRQRLVPRARLRPVPLLAVAATMSAGLVGLVQPASAHAADSAAPAAAPLRSTKAIMADHVAALGGKAALSRHKTLHVKRTITIKGMGITGNEERFAATGDRFLSVTSIPGIGTVRQGSDGKVFWSEDPINGLRLLTGSEKAQARIDGSWNAELRLAKLYKKVTPVPPPANAPAGAALECLQLVPDEGHPMVMCFDAQTHQRVFQTGRQATPQGELPFEARFSEWREFEGISVPTLEQTTAGPTTIEARVSDVKFGEKLDPGLFKLKDPGQQAAAAPAAKPTAPAAKPTAPAPRSGGDLVPPAARNSPATPAP